ncbi:MAG TPA: hypothetical protein VJ963_00250 [Bacteroidales bacterium]|nr:hypothetical protein [Bacteroidales bacterium]
MLKKPFISILLILTMAVNAGGMHLCMSHQKDTLPDNQALINGRIWANHYYMISGDQFLFSNVFLNGSISMKGRFFKEVILKYDILNDELLMPLDSGKVLQINKQLVDSFTLSFHNRTYHFTKAGSVNPALPTGFINILYKGKNVLAVKYMKKIDRLNIEGTVDNFYLLTRIYLVSDKKVTLLRNKRDLYEAAEPYKSKLKAFFKKQIIYYDRNNPDSYIPVLKYLDKISQ